MSIIKITQFWQGDTVHQSTDKYLREYTQKFVVVTNDASDDINTILSSGSPLPTLNSDTYPTDDGALCYEVDGQKVKPTEWNLTYKYSSNPPLPSQAVEDPTARPAVWKIGWNQYEKPMIVDLVGVSVVNSALQPFEQPPTAQRGRMRITIDKNYAIADDDSAVAAWAMSVQVYLDSCNMDEWFGFPPFSCRLVGMDATTNEENQIHYLKVTYNIETSDYDNMEFWNVTQILDCGYATLNEAGALSPILINGVPPSKPQLLDGEGQVLSPILAGDEVYQQFQFYAPADWSGIP